MSLLAHRVAQQNNISRTYKRVQKLIKLGEISFSHTDNRWIASGRLSKLLELREFTLSRGLSHRIG